MLRIPTPAVAAGNSGTFLLGAGTDDGYDPTTGVDYANNLAIVVGNINASFNGYTSWLRFPGVSIPQGATITSAVLRPTASQLQGTIPPTRIFANAADDAAAPTTHADVLAKALTAASVDWTPTAWVVDTQYTSPDLTAVVQEVINRAGWVSGNALMIMWKVITPQSTTRALRSYSFDTGTADKRARLAVTWT